MVFGENKFILLVDISLPISRADKIIQDISMSNNIAYIAGSILGAGSADSIVSFIILWAIFRKKLQLTTTRTLILWVIFIIIEGSTIVILNPFNLILRTILALVIASLILWINYKLFPFKKAQSNTPSSVTQDKEK